jgi:hypothetical protein
MFLPTSLNMFLDRSSAICPLTRLQCCLVIVSQRRSDKRSIIHFSFERFRQKAGVDPSCELSDPCILQELTILCSGHERLYRPSPIRPSNHSFITDKADKKMVIVDGAGHDLTISHPKEVCDALVALLSGKGWDS